MFKSRENQCNILGIGFFSIVTIIEYITVLTIIAIEMEKCAYILLAGLLLLFNASLCFFSRKCGRAMEDYLIEEELNENKTDTE